MQMNTGVIQEKFWMATRQELPSVHLQRIAVPMGLCFDTKKTLSKDFKGDGFVIRFTSGENSSLMRPFTNQGSDLLHLRMVYDKATDNYVVKTTRIVEGFNDPVDAVIIGNSMYIIEYGGQEGNIWKIILPVDTKAGTKSKNKS